MEARRRLRRGDDFRVIQFTPPGSGCSVIFGKNVTAAAPGSAQGLYLIVSDIEAARDELLGRGVEVSEVFHDAGGVYARFGRALPVWAAPGQRSGSRASQLPLVRLVQRSGRQRLAVPGDHDAAARAHRPRDDDLRVGERSGERASACGGRPRRAREAHRAGGRELARLVRRIHGPRSRPGRVVRPRRRDPVRRGGPELDRADRRRDRRQRRHRARDARLARAREPTSSSPAATRPPAPRGLELGA